MVHVKVATAGLVARAVAPETDVVEIANFGILVGLFERFAEFLGFRVIPNGGLGEMGERRGCSGVSQVRKVDLRYVNYFFFFGRMSFQREITLKKYSSFVFELLESVEPMPTNTKLKRAPMVKRYGSAMHTIRLIFPIVSAFQVWFIPVSVVTSRNLCRAMDGHRGDHCRNIDATAASIISSHNSTNLTSLDHMDKNSRSQG